MTGKATAYGNTRTSCLFQEGGTIDVTLTPIGDKADSYLPVVIRKGGSDTTGKGALSLKGEIINALGRLNENSTTNTEVNKRKNR